MEMPDLVQIPIQFRRIGFGKRLLANLIDGSVAAAGGLVAALFVTAAGLFELSMLDIAQLAEMQEMYATMGLERDLATEVLMFTEAFLIGSMGIALVLSLMEALMGASLGKLAMQIAIGTIDGRKGSRDLWLKRWMIKNSGTLLSVVGALPVLSFLEGVGQLLGIIIIIGCFFAIGTERLALHDRIAQTAVYHKDDLQ